MDKRHLHLILVGCLYLGLASVSSLEMECKGIEEPDKYILCYANSTTSLPMHVDVCRCSHLVVPLAVNTISNANITLDEELVDFLKASGSRNGGRLSRVLSLTVAAEDFSAISSIQSMAASVAGLIDDLLIEGVEIYWQRPTIDKNSKRDKANLVLFMKELHAVLHEKIIVTSSTDAIGDMTRTSAGDIGEIDATRPLILLRLPTAPEYLVKAFDLKPLAKTVDLFVIATHEMADANNVTYHHSRLMGLSDILNTDSVMDLVASLGVSSDRVVAAVPTFAVQFRLMDVRQNLPGSPVIEDPVPLRKEQLCSMLSKGNWTVERDEDLTGTYAYSDGGDWIAFDDEIAAQIKAKYFLLRDVAGVAMMPANMNDELTYGCNPDIREPSTVQIYYDQFQYQGTGERTRRQLATSLQEDVSSVATALSSPIYNDRVRASPYRIVRIVSRSGETSVIRQPLESSLQCSRQGYYRHPEDCSRFYRCVKFDQYVDDFTVFEYDCPEGLVFDEKYEVCTWPSQTAPCGGSSEIRPVPMNKFVCPGEGYFADPENCRWFFACRDYAKDGSPFTQYEFRCPFGLLFDQQNFICNWPWLVPQCSGAGSLGSVASTSNTGVVKSKAQLETKQPSAIAIGSPGYLSGKLVTGQGLYRDARPGSSAEAVASAGCIDCQSAGLVVRHPSQDTDHRSPTAKPTKLVLAIPASTIADQSTPVRIIVASAASPASSSQQEAASTPPHSDAHKYLSTGTASHESPDRFSSHGPSGYRGWPLAQPMYESLSSSGLPAPSTVPIPTSSALKGSEQLPVYATEHIERQRPFEKDESRNADDQTRSKDDGYRSAGYNGGRVKDVPDNSPATFSQNEVAGGFSYQGEVKTGKYGSSGRDASSVYLSGLGSETAQGERDRYSDVAGVGHAGSIHTEGKSSGLSPHTTTGYSPNVLEEGSVASYEASQSNSPSPQSQEGSAGYQAPTTEESLTLSYTPRQQPPYPAAAWDQKRPSSAAHPVPVSLEKVSASFREAPALVPEKLVATSVYRGPPVYQAPSSVHQTPDPVRQPWLPAYEDPAPVDQTLAPPYEAPAPAPASTTRPSADGASAAALETSAPIYPAPARAYQSFSTPVYRAPVPAHQVPSSVSKNPSPSDEAAVPVYQAAKPYYEGPTLQTPAFAPEATAAVYKASIRTHQTHADPEERSPSVYAPSATVAPSQADEAIDPSYKPLLSGHQTMAAVDQTSFPIDEQSSSIRQSSMAVDPVPSRVREGPNSVDKAPWAAVMAISSSRPSGGKAAASQAMPSSYEASVPTYGTGARSVDDVPVAIYQDRLPVESSAPYTHGSSAAARPLASPASGFQPALVQAKSSKASPAVWTRPHADDAAESADGQTATYPASSPSRKHGGGGHGQQSPAAVAAYAHDDDDDDETTGRAVVSGGDSPAPAGTKKTNGGQTFVRRNSSRAYEAESADRPRVHHVHVLGEDTTVARVSASPFAQHEGRERDQAPKETESNKERATAAPRGRFTSSAVSVVRGVKQPTKGNVEIGGASGSRRRAGAAERRGAHGVGAVGEASRTGGVDETRRASIASRTQGRAGSRKIGGVRDKAYGAAAGSTGATGHTATDSSLAWQRPSSRVHGKGSSQPTYSPTIRDQDDDETWGLLEADTFGLKKDVQTSTKSTSARPVSSRWRTASANDKADANADARITNGTMADSGGRRGDDGNRDSSGKQLNVPAATGRAGYKGADARTQKGQAQSTFGTDTRSRPSNSDATLATPTAPRRDHVSRVLTDDRAVAAYGDKRVTVKVPSTNKAAILEKWASASWSAVDPQADLLEAKTPVAAGDESSLKAMPARSGASTNRATSNNRLPVQKRITAKPKKQDLNAGDALQSAGEQGSAIGTGPSSARETTSDDGFGQLAGSEYGHRYLEKMTVAQATARNETLGSEVCVRAGLFRHPYDCQKFYECYWDRWIYQYTVHIFKCPVHLVYDDYITACNWPLDGPACVPHEPVKLYAQLPSAA